MALHKIHEGSFYSRAGIEWIVQIFRNQSSAPSSVGELTFPDSSPLVIEWKETSKEDVICESSATLKIISPGDRTYIDLYAEGPTDVMLKVFRNDTSHLYWCGFLDPEFYEEPYSTYNNYEVSFTFSDFGVLKRIPFSGTGMLTLQQIVEGSTGPFLLNYSYNFSTAIAGTLIQLNAVQVYAENFFDEDGIAMSQYDVLEGVLRPLAARIIQRNGQFEIYDINKLFLDSQTNDIVWGSDDQVLGMDKVVNNIIVTLSCYDSATKSAVLKYQGLYDASKINWTMNIPSDGEYYSFYKDYQNNRGERPLEYHSFTIFLSQNASGVQSKHQDAKYFKIMPILGGEECEGILQRAYLGHRGMNVVNNVPLITGLTHIGTNRDYSALFSTSPMRLGPVSNTSKYGIRILYKILADARYNPFSEPDSNNDGGNATFLGDITRLALRVKIELLNDAGTVLYHYVNSNVIANSENIAFSQLRGNWVAGAAGNTDCYLMWYKEDLEGSPIDAGWIGNRQACHINAVRYLSAAVKAAVDGQYIPYPPCSGLIRITPANYFDQTGGGSSVFTYNQDARWWLHQLPEISIVNSNLTKSDIESEDIEYSGVANISAKDGLEIDEICGTMTDPSPTARGLLLNSSGLPITSMTRQSRTDTAEQLLIGTLYSQFASRKITLSGTAMASGGLKLQYTDAALPDKKLMMLAALEECKEDEIYLKVAEFSQDNYTRQSS